MDFYCDITREILSYYYYYYYFITETDSGVFFCIFPPEKHLVDSTMLMFIIIVYKQKVDFSLGHHQGDFKNAFALFCYYYITTSR